MADDHAVIEYALAFLDEAHTETSARAGSAVACATSVPRLTRREQEVLVLLVRGMTDRQIQISETLFISRKTASDHVAYILTKLGAVNRTGAVAAALREGLVEPSA